MAQRTRKKAQPSPDGWAFLSAHVLLLRQRGRGGRTKQGAHLPALIFPAVDKPEQRQGQAGGQHEDAYPAAGYAGEPGHSQRNPDQGQPAVEQRDRAMAVAGNHQPLVEVRTVGLKGIFAAPLGH